MDLGSWHFTKNGQTSGPVSMDVLRQMLASGALGAHDMVWKEGWAQWQSVSSVPELRGATPPAHASVAQLAQPPQQPTQVSYTQPYAYTGQSYNGFAIAGFVLSLIPVASLLGLIFSLIALNGMKKSGNPEGHGLAVAGLVISLIIVSLGRLYLLAVFTCFGAMVGHNVQ
jgi:hypothetical protein